MMTPEEHEAEAERLLNFTGYPDLRAGLTGAIYNWSTRAAAAQAHATLAQSKRQGRAWDQIDSIVGMLVNTGRL